MLIVGQIPPPYHGQSILTGYLNDHEWHDVSVITLPLRYSSTIQNVGKFNLGKVLTLVLLVLKTWLLAYVHRPRVLYYLPASPNLVPVLRDYLYLKSVRWMFPKTIFHFHAGGLDDYLESLGCMGKILRECYMGPDMSIDVNQFDRPTGDYFMALENRIVWNGVKVVYPRREEPVNRPLFKVLYVGLLSEEKGVKCLIQAAKILSERGESVEFHLVGKFASVFIERDVMSFLDDHELHDSVILKGAKYDVDKWAEFSTADMLIFPSRHPTETFGIVLAEAMAFSLPIVASDWRSTGKVVSDECAILCDPYVEEDFADAIRELLNNENKRKAMGKAGYLRYLERFTSSQFLNGIEKIFTKVVSS